jgi:hypothetical protein
MENRSLIRNLHIPGPGHLRLFCDLHLQDISLQHRRNKFENQVNAIFCCEKYARMTCHRIRAKESKEVRETIHGSPHIHLRPATLFHHLVQAFAAPALDFERLKPFDDFEAIGENDDVRWDVNFLAWGFTCCVVWVGIGAAWP